MPNISADDMSRRINEIFTEILKQDSFLMKLAANQRDHLVSQLNQYKTALLEQVKEGDFGYEYAYESALNLEQVNSNGQLNENGTIANLNQVIFDIDLFHKKSKKREYLKEIARGAAHITGASLLCATGITTAILMAVFINLAFAALFGTPFLLGFTTLAVLWIVKVVSDESKGHIVREKAKPLCGFFDSLVNTQSPVANIIQTSESDTSDSRLNCEPV